jgi:hypothetical protein
MGTKYQFMEEGRTKHIQIMLFLFFSPSLSNIMLLSIKHSEKIFPRQSTLQLAVIPRDSIIHFRSFFKPS